MRGRKIADFSSPIPRKFKKGDSNEDPKCQILQFSKFLIGRKRKK
jgi:hypothetical protein